MIKELIPTFEGKYFINKDESCFIFVKNIFEKKDVEFDQNIYFRGIIVKYTEGQMVVNQGDFLLLPYYEEGYKECPNVWWSEKIQDIVEAVFICK